MKRLKRGGGDLQLILACRHEDQILALLVGDHSNRLIFRGIECSQHNFGTRYRGSTWVAHRPKQARSFSGTSNAANQDEQAKQSKKSRQAGSRFTRHEHSYLQIDCNYTCNSFSTARPHPAMSYVTPLSFALLPLLPPSAVPDYLSGLSSNYFPSNCYYTYPVDKHSLILHSRLQRSRRICSSPESLRRLRAAIDRRACAFTRSALP